MGDNENIYQRVVSYYSNSSNELAQRYIDKSLEVGTVEYYETALRQRYEMYPEIPRIAEFDQFSGRDVLEIGVGQGSDHFMFAKNGAAIKGIDLTEKHCRMTRDFLRAFNLDSCVVNGNATKLPFDDESFDHVYSNGVLLLVPNLEAAMSEILRVLRPGGSATIMLYNKRSIHYWIKTRLFYGWALNEDDILGKETVNDWYTDGPGYARVYHYGPSDLRWIFSGFSKISYQTSCLSEEQMPFVGLPEDVSVRRWLERRWGFFLWGKAFK